MNFREVWAEKYRDPWGLAFPQGPSKKRTSTFQISNDAQRRLHELIAGLSGTGKSYKVMHQAMIDVTLRLNNKSNRGWIMLDVTGDLYKDMRDRLALAALVRPELKSLLHLVDPSNEEWGVVLDLLKIERGQSLETKVDNLSTVISEVFIDDPTITVTLKRALYYLFLLLGYARLNLADAPSVLADTEYRNEILAKLNHPDLNRYWIDDFPKHHQGILDRLSSTVNRIGLVVSHPDMAHLFRGEETLNIPSIMDKGAFILVNAHNIGEQNGRMLCAFLIAAVLQAAQRRGGTSAERVPFTIYADEFQEYLRETIERVDRLGRKYRIELVLATQNLIGRGSGRELMDAVINTVGTYTAFQLSMSNARLLAPNLMTPSLDQIKHAQMKYQTGLGGSREDYWDYTFMSQDEIWERECRKLTSLPDRHFYTKARRGNKTKLMVVPTLIPVSEWPLAEMLPEALMQQDEAAFNLAGRLKTKALPPPRGVSNQQVQREDMKTDESTLWSE